MKIDLDSDKKNKVNKSCLQTMEKLKDIYPQNIYENEDFQNMLKSNKELNDLAIKINPYKIYEVQWLIYVDTVISNST